MWLIKKPRPDGLSLPFQLEPRHYVLNLLRQSSSKRFEEEICRLQVTWYIGQPLLFLAFARFRSRALT